MFDKELALDSLHTIASALQLIVERASVVSTPDDFLCSPDGMLRLDAICMNAKVTETVIIFLRTEIDCMDQIIAAV